MENIFFVVESFLRKLISEEVTRAINKSGTQSVNNNDDWVSLDEAKKIIPMSSKRKWQELRDTGEIIFSKAGRSYLYSVSSLRCYLLKKSNSKKIKS